MPTTFICIRCGEPATRHSLARASMCDECMDAHREDGRRATAEVTKAIRAGLLDRAELHRCIDCCNPARDWDHRDYLRPLEVEPVCRPCNLRRPPAFDSAYRPKGEASKPHFDTMDRRRREYRKAA